MVITCKILLKVHYVPNQGSYIIYHVLYVIYNVHTVIAVYGGEGMISDLKEPEDIKSRFFDLLSKDEELAKATIKQSSWLAKYIWDEKKETLRKRGITWQMVMSAVRNSYPLVLSWILGRFSWRDLLDFIEKQLEHMVIIIAGA